MKRLAAVWVGLCWLAVISMILALQYQSWSAPIGKRKAESEAANVRVLAQDSFKGGFEP